MSAGQDMRERMDLAYRRARLDRRAAGGHPPAPALDSLEATQLLEALRESAPAAATAGAMLEPAPPAQTASEPDTSPEVPVMRTVLLDIDTQFDFCAPRGLLYVPGADAPQVRNGMNRLIAAARAADIVRIATADDHQASDPEISDAPDFQTTFPPHCMRGTDGAMRVPETRLVEPLVLGDGAYEDDRFADLVSRHNDILLLKQHFNAFTNQHLDRVLDLLEPERVVVFGVATDICVNAAVEGLVRRRSHLPEEFEIVVVDDACAGLDPHRVARCQAAWDDARVRRMTAAQAVRMMLDGSKAPTIGVEG